MVGIKQIFSHLRRAAVFVLLPAIFAGSLTQSAWADAPLCTTDPEMNLPSNMFIVSQTVDAISCILYGKVAGNYCGNTTSVTENLFNSVAFQTYFMRTIKAVLALYVVIFAISFMLGLIQLTIVEFSIRVIKFGLIGMFVTSKFTWDFFGSTVGIFFHDGTNWLISFALQTTFGALPGLDPSNPFALIDYGIQLAFSSRMFVTIVAMFLTGPYGWLFGMLVLLSLGAFIAALLQAMWIYLLSLIIRAFLFGLAPIFIPFILFQKTRHLFDGWLNQLVNSMLQPVLLFTFFSFFMTLTGTAMLNILHTPVCYLRTGALFSGSPVEMDIPTFKLKIGNEWHYYGGKWDHLGPVERIPNAPQPVFPISIMDVLIFLILVQLAWKFNSVAIHIAKELSGSATNYNMPMMGNIFSPSRSNTLHSIGNKTAPGMGAEEIQRAKLQAQANRDIGQPPVNQR